MLFKKILTGLLVGHSLVFINTSHASSESTWRSERALFIEAEKSLQQRHWDRYHPLKKRLSHYPLLPYLLYAEYEQGLATLSSETFYDYLQKYSDTPLAEQLRVRWLQQKAKQENWQAFLSAYEPTEDLSLQCHYLWASLQTGKDPSMVFKQIATLWMRGKGAPKSCEAVFDVFEKSGHVTRPMAWQRVKLLIQEGQNILARKMHIHLKRSEMALVELWMMVRQNPMLVTQARYFQHKHPAHLEMLVDGVSLIANDKPSAAIRIWQQISTQYPFTERHWGLVVRAIGLRYAADKHPDAEKWLSRVPAIYTNEAVNEWRVRTALFKEDWPQVIHWINHLPADLAKKEEWQYWHGRALERVNYREASQQIFRKLSHLRSYYGLLASHQLLKPYSVHHQKLSVSKDLVTRLSHRTAIQRARELHFLKRHDKARAQWRYETRRMTDQEKHAAAFLALRWEQPNWSILALAAANHQDDLSLRFPIVYGVKIFEEAQRNKIDPAWILAVARQESAFVSHAKSTAGALGVMQLIPSTAQMVAKKRNLAFAGESTLLEPYTNIQLGSSYLKMMLEKHQDNSILATVAYNAGPGRIRQWLPTYDMAADLWIETIPYKESRDYIKNILIYTAVYQEMLGGKSNMARYMRYIPSQKTLMAFMKDPKKNAHE